MVKVLRVVLMIGVMTVIVSLLTLFLGGNYTVYNLIGVSMKPTYEDGDMVVINKNKEVEKNDVVIFNYDDEEGRYSGSYVKRVVGLPGDNIGMNEEGFLTINGETYINKLTGDKVRFSVDNDERIRHNEYYVIGDNSENSIDSRVLGTIDKDSLTGVVTSIHIKGRQ